MIRYKVTGWYQFLFSCITTKGKYTRVSMIERTKLRLRIYICFSLLFLCIRVNNEISRYSFPDRCTKIGCFLSLQGKNN